MLFSFSKMLQIPKFDFEPRDTNALHTLVMFDMDVVGLGPSPNFMHYVIVNIPGLCGLSLVLLVHTYTSLMLKKR